MKKVYYLLIFLLSLTFVPEAEASHNIGGEIRWECVDSGKYVFYLDIYVNCYRYSASWEYDNNYTDINIVGAPLPRGIDNNIISTFSVYPDSSKWERLNRGDLSPICNQGSPDQLSCGDNLTTRAYYYKSDPLVIRGVPPDSGWAFIYQPPCCWPDVENLVSPTSKTMNLRAKMYPTANNQNTDPCIDSSPEFSALPASMICRGNTFTYNHTAIDQDLDSIVYALDRTYNTYPNQPAAYKVPQYNYNNPTPDQRFDSSNVPATINSKTGILNLSVYSGSSIQKYWVVVRADAFKDGKRISSIFREIPYYVIDCPPIDSVTSNSQPEFYFDNVKQNEYEIVVEAGVKVEFPVQAMDNDSGATGLPQEVTLFTSGNQFATDFVDTANCANPPCAVLKNNVPQYDSVRNRYQISGANTVTTNFEWQTNCGHLNADGSQKTYYFYFSGKDDHCPVPQQIDTYVKVTVGAAGFIDAPKAACVGDFDSKHIFSWTAGSGLQANFTKWYIYAANTTNQLQLIDSIADFNTMYYEDTLQYEDYQVRTTSSCGTKSVVYQSQKVQIGYQENPMEITIIEQNRVLTVNNPNADNFHWYDCNADTIITDSTRQSFAPQDSGSFASIVAKGYCVDTTDCVRIFPVGLNENNFQNSINFYPNPSNGLVNIELPQKQASLQIKVRNIHGQLVQEEQFVKQNNLQLQLNGKPGIYFIELVNAKGERANVKVVKR